MNELAVITNVPSDCTSPPGGLLGVGGGEQDYMTFNSDIYETCVIYPWVTACSGSAVIKAALINFMKCSGWSLDVSPLPKCDSTSDLSNMEPVMRCLTNLALDTGLPPGED